MSRLALLFLGSPRVIFDDATVVIDRRKVLALLAYLAVTAERHSRDELAELLFGKHDREHARANLRRSLSYLRSAIGGTRLGTDRLSVWLPNEQDLSIDVTEYQHLLSSLQKADIQDDPSARGKRLAKAVELYRGDFLSGFFVKDSYAFEEWQLMVQENLRRKQAFALKQLLEIHGARCQYEQAIDYGKRWLCLDRLEETAHRRLMKLYSLAGRRSEALRQYEECRSLLERELGEQPEKETELLRERIEARKLLPGLVQMPTGTVIFLFADIAGSIELWENHSDQMKVALAKYNEIMKKVMVLHEGFTFKTLRDAFHVAFYTASNALSAALDVQLALKEESWSVPGGIRVRTALHVGEAVQKDNDYFGPTIDRVARLLSAAHGSQVLLTTAMAEIAKDVLPDHTSLTFLGSFRLKDLNQEQALYQLIHPDLTSGFPDLVTLDTRPNNLPLQPTPLIGREKELAGATALLMEESVRLMTLTGPGGTGKTRLALQIAADTIDRFEHGVFFIDLAPYTDPDDVLRTVHRVLGIIDTSSSDGSILELLKEFLSKKCMLLVMDNFEQILDAAAYVVELISTCPSIKIIVTSREPLQVRVEREIPIQPLEVPDLDVIQSVEQLSQYEAVRLFIDRSVSVKPDFTITNQNAPAISEICVRLDGLPLAIELAAVRVKALPPETLLKRLTSSLWLLKGGPRDLPSRQQTLRSAIDWSHGLLEPEEKVLFRRLSVFAGGCTLERAETACVDDRTDLEFVNSLSSLVNKSLLRVEEHNGRPMYMMLRTIREYALEKLNESREEESVFQRFISIYTDLAADAESNLFGPDQGSWFDELDSEYGNFVAAFQWLREHGDHERGLGLAKSLGWYWYRCAYYNDGRHWLTSFLELTEGQKLPHLQAWAYWYLGCIIFAVLIGPSREQQFVRCFERSLVLHREAEDRRGEALSLALVSVFAHRRGDRDLEGNPVKNVRRMMDKSVTIAQESGDEWAIGLCTLWKTIDFHTTIEHQEAGLKETMKYARKTGESFLMFETLKAFGNMYYKAKRYADSKEWYDKANELAHNVAAKDAIIEMSHNMARLNLDFGRLAEAWDNAVRSIQLIIETGAKFYWGEGLHVMIRTAVAGSKPELAARLVGIRSTVMTPKGTSPVHDLEIAREFQIEIDEESFTTEWTAGQSMTEDEILRYISENHP